MSGAGSVRILRDSHAYATPPPRSYVMGHSSQPAEQATQDVTKEAVNEILERVSEAASGGRVACVVARGGGRPRVGEPAGLLWV
jgi:hypothetical protein